MTDQRPVARRRPLPLAMLLGFYRFIASSALATILIATLAIVLAWATLWIERRYGTAAAQFAVYQSPWFALLLAVLAVNILAAALIRFPWQRKQIGFLIVHSGILVLLLGCWVSREKGREAIMNLYEGNTSSTAISNERQFSLVVRSTDKSGSKPSTPADKSNGTSPDVDTATAQLIEIPFRPGPFNWSDYNALSRFPWHWGQRDGGVLYDRDGVRLEVLDYCNDSRRVPVPELMLRLPEPATLNVREVRIPHMPHQALIVGSQANLAAKTTFEMAPNREATEAFRNSRPEGTLGQLGQMVLHAKGKKYPFLVENILDKKAISLGDSGVHIRLIQFDPELLRVWLETYTSDKDESRGLLLLSAVRVEIDQQDAKNGVYGTYWFYPSKSPFHKESDEKSTQGGEEKKQDNKSDDEKGQTEKTATATLPTIPEAAVKAATEPRVDILQGSDEHLYYRTWRDGHVEKIDRLPADGSTVVVFADSDSPIEYAVESFLPAAKPGSAVVPVAFDRDKKLRQERVLVRLTVDGQKREFWLASPLAGDPSERFGGVHGDKHMAMIRFERPTIDLGFKVHLRDFLCQYDPGTSRPSHHESRVDFLSNDQSGKVFREDVAIGTNRPAEFTDPISGRTFRFFQNSYKGPFAPEEVAAQPGKKADQNGDQIYQSGLMVTYDPGRQLKYAGCFMILAGIMVMYYMKAYFFKRRERPGIIKLQGNTDFR